MAGQTCGVTVYGFDTREGVVEADTPEQALAIVRNEVEEELSFEVCEVYTDDQPQARASEGGTRMDRMETAMDGVLDILREHAALLRNMADAERGGAAERKPGIWRRIADWTQAAWQNETVRRIGAAAGAWIAKMTAGLFRRGK